MTVPFPHSSPTHGDTEGSDTPAHPGEHPRGPARQDKDTKENGSPR